MSLRSFKEGKYVKIETNITVKLSILGGSIQIAPLKWQPSWATSASGT